MKIAIAVAGVLLWVILAMVMADGAVNRKKSGIGYFLLSLFLSPFIAFMILMVSAPIPVDKEKSQD